MAKSYIVGNWKMNQNRHELNEFFGHLEKEELNPGNFWIAPQFIHIQTCIEKTNKVPLKIGAQNCSDQTSGAFTGEISPSSLADIEAHFVILGHSERRALFNESNELINSKVKAVMGNKLVPILCVGETLEQRESNETMNVVLDQVTKGLQGVKLGAEDDIIIAYEPVWAIGTGKTASPEQAEEVHAGIREKLKELYPECGENISILYGGSVKPNNIDDLIKQPNINGGLVGGASLKAEDFMALCRAIN
ncbi:MAG: triose-phosphate isomerase [Halobacteriovoraceae bacterium]|nr:triose-phosphate isomerase [Halobacteriovoraceae bacterium]|tara:strand:- start:8796 stop:9542 length:747 start_codon:yes stop_codon:yes gene_type:complete